ncbi:hypothetical protein Hanom_Chr15g01414141 [Helianthus anomalus]
MLGATSTKVLETLPSKVVRLVGLHAKRVDLVPKSCGFSGREILVQKGLTKPRPGGKSTGWLRVQPSSRTVG